MSGGVNYYRTLGINYLPRPPTVKDSIPPLPKSLISGTFIHVGGTIETLPNMSEGGYCTPWQDGETSIPKYPPSAAPMPVLTPYLTSNFPRSGCMPWR